MTIRLVTILFLTGIQLFAESTGIRGRVAIQRKSSVSREELINDKKWEESRSEALDAKRANLILNIKKFLASAQHEAQKTELNLRLGSLYMEDYRARLTRPGKGKTTKNGLSEDAIQSLNKARSIYSDLLRRYPTHPRKDEMLYFLGQANVDSGKSKEGIAFYERLTREAPNSKLVPDALIQIGDYYFDQGQFAVAEKYYDQMIAKRNQQLISYATYKKAWCAYNLGRTRESVDLFKWVVAHEETSEVGRTTRMKSEALVDICNPLVELDAVDEAIFLFQAQDEKAQRRGLETVARLLSSKGQYPKSVKVYELLLSLNANYDRNPEYELGIVDALKLSKNSKAAIQRLLTLLPRYLDNSNWFEIHSPTPKVIQAAKASFEDVTRTYALQTHAEAQRSKNEEIYQRAEALYQKYLEYFSKFPASPEMRFNLAEILYRREMYTDAAEHYFKVYKEPGAKKYRYDAIHNAILALDKQLNNERKEQGLGALSSKSVTKLKDEGEPTKSAYSPTETRFIEVSKEYLTAFPAAKDAADVLYSRSYLHYVHYDFVEALLGFNQVIEKYTGHQTSYAAANLSLDIFNRQKDYARLIQSCQKYLALKALAKPEFRAEVADVLRKAELKTIQLVEEKGNYKEAAEKYLTYTRNYGDQDVVLYEKALYNASVNFAKANILLQAAEVQEQFLRRFPNSKLKENVLIQVAKTYEGLGSFRKAAQYFETFFKTYNNHANSKAALRMAGLYYWASGETAKAESLMWQFMSYFPAEAKGVEQNLTELYRFTGSTDKVAGFWDKKRNAHNLSIENFVVYSMKYAETVARLQDGNFPGRVLEQLAKYAPKASTSNADVAEAVAKYYMLHTMAKRKYFDAISLTGAQAQLQKKLATKLQYLKELDKDYMRIVGIGNPDMGLAAAYRLATLYMSMANEVQQAPVPGELSGEELEAYRNELNRQMVQPFLEKAQNFAAQCLEKSTEFHLLSHWTSKCYSAASALNPERYPLVQTFYLPSLRLALMVPDAEKVKYEIGRLKDEKYPYGSAPLFQNMVLKRIENLPPVANLYDDDKFSDEMPKRIVYRNFLDERRDALNSRLNSTRPSDSKKGYSFAYLNYSRLQTPDRAIVMIRQMLERFPGDASLNNLLALSYFELGDLAAAKAIWLSLTARDIKDPAIFNNLGVIASLLSEDTQALTYFTEASSGENPLPEALENLGFASLKYRNGSEAKKYFEKLADIKKTDIVSQIGIGVAYAQNREMSNAKDALKDVSNDNGEDVFAHLSYAYYLIDAEKEREEAKKVLSDLSHDDPTVEKEVLIREAMDYSQRLPASQSGQKKEALPDLED